MRMLVSTIAALSLLVLAAPPAAAGSKAETVRFQDYPGLGNLIVRVARSKGWCAERGLDCELSMIPNAPLGMQALIGGSIDAAMAPIDVLMSAVRRGAKVEAVAGAAVSNIFMLVVSNKVATPDGAKGYAGLMHDLKGKTIGVTARGAATETLATFLLERAGMSAGDVTFVAVGATNTAYGALVSGQVDAVMTWEPVGLLCEITKKCRVAWRSATASEPRLVKAMNGAGTVLAFRDEYVAAHPKAIAAVLALSKQAAAFINDPANAKEVLAISSQYFKFDMPHGDYIAQRVLGLARDFHTYEPAIDRRAVAATQDYLIKTKQLGGAIPLDRFVYSGAPQ